MKITNKEIVIIDNYIEILNKNKKMFFYDVIPELIKDYSKKISKNICYGLNDFKECSSPSDTDIQDKISDVLDDLLCDYFSDISNYIRRENQIIYNYIIRIDKNSYEFEQDRLIERLEFNQVPRSEQIKNLQNTLIDRINIHIAIRNQLNGEYYKISREVEKFVREKINAEYPKFVEELETVYSDLVNRFTQEKNDTLNDISKFKEAIEENLVLPEKIEGELNLHDLSNTTLEIEGELNLPDLSNSAELNLPEKIEGELNLDALKKVKEMINPEPKEGELNLPEKTGELNLPDLSNTTLEIEGKLNLPNLSNSAELNLPEKIEGELNLPEKIEGELNLSKVENIGYNFLQDNKQLTNINLPKVEIEEHLQKLKDIKETLSSETQEELSSLPKRL